MEEEKKMHQQSPRMTMPSNMGATPNPDFDLLGGGQGMPQ